MLTENTMQSVMDGIVHSLNQPDVKVVEKEKKEEKKEEAVQKKEEPNEVDGIGEIEDLIGDSLTKEDKDEVLKDVEERLKKGESLASIRKEVEDGLKEDEEESSEEEKEEDNDEDLVPKSKVEDIKAKMQKRIDSEVAKRKELESKLDTKPDDNDKKLDNMSVEELQSVKKQIRRALRHEDDDNKLDELEDLLDKVDEKIKTQPQRFFQKQMTNLSKILPDISEVYKDVETQINTGKGELVELAKTIYQRSRSMQGSPEGWAEAFQMAFEHLEGLKTVSPKKDDERVNSLSRRLNTLKKKTTLSGKQSVANQESINSRKLYKKAVEGDVDDKLEYVRKNLLTPFGKFD